MDFTDKPLWDRPCPALQLHPLPLSLLRAQPGIQLLALPLFLFFQPAELTHLRTFLLDVSPPGGTFPESPPSKSGYLFHSFYPTGLSDLLQGLSTLTK